MAQQTTAVRRVPLNRDRVLRAAVELADEAGIDALNMRNLAQMLGVVPMAPYKHVANKEELLDGMVDVVVGADGPNQVCLRGTAHAGHFRAERLGDLHSESADASPRTTDQDLLPRLQPSDIPESLQGGETGHRNGCSLLECDVGRLRRQVLRLGQGVLGVRADPHAEDLIPRLELGHVPADRLDNSRQV